MKQINFLSSEPIIVKNQVKKRLSCPISFGQALNCDIFIKRAPFKKNEYPSNIFTMQSKINFEDTIKKIKNNPLLLTISEIRNSPVDFSPNSKPTKLNPMDIEASALALVHMSDYEPKNGIILSQRDKLGGSRNSVHFSLNHAVGEHDMGNWNDMNYAIIAPYNSTIKENRKGKFIEGMPDDIYTNGSVKLPSDSVIIKYNDKIPTGEIRISEYTDDSGIKMIETSQKPHALVPSVLEKMGYSNINADTLLGTFNYGEQNGQSEASMMNNYLAWAYFCEKNNIKPVMHSVSPGCVAEDLFEALDSLSVENSWSDSVDGTSYKDRILFGIGFVQKWQRKGYYVSYDTEKFRSIIEASKTPLEAIKKLNDELKIHPTFKREKFDPQFFEDYKEIYEDQLNALDDKEKMQTYIKTF